MRFFNDNIESSVGVSSIDQGEYIGVGYTSFLPPQNGLIVQGNVGIGITNPSAILQVGSVSTNNILYVGSGFIGINTNLQSQQGPEGLIVNQIYNGLLNTSASVITGISSVNNYSGITIWNRNNGNNASSDFIAVANIGGVANTYIDVGINNSNYNQGGLYGNALDAYVLSTGNNLNIANVNSGYSIQFITGTSYFNLPVMIITSTPIGVGGSVGINTIYPTQNLDINGPVRFRNAIYDVNNSHGVSGQVLSSTGAGIAWTTGGSGGGGSIGGSIAQNQVAYGLSANNIQGSNNLFFTGTALGIGTSSMISTVVVQSQGINSSVFRVQGLSGTLFETFDTLTGVLEQVSNVSGLPVFQVNDGVAAPNAVIYIGGIGQTYAILSLQTSGGVINSFSTTIAYFGNSIGVNSLNPTQNIDLNGTIIFRGKVFDSNTSNGLAGSILASIGTGVIWVPPTVGGGGNGNITVSAPMIPFATASNTLSGVSTFVYYGIGSVGVGTQYPTQTLDINGGARFRTTLYDVNNVPGISGQLLSSTGAGITWVNATGGGNISGTVGAGQVVFGSGTNNITSTASIIANGSGIGINTNFVNTPFVNFNNILSFSSSQWYSQLSYPVGFISNFIQAAPPGANAIMGLWNLNNTNLGSVSGGAIRGLQSQNFINYATNTQHVGLLGYNYFRHSFGVNTGNTYAVWGLNQFSSSGGVTSSAIELYASTTISLGHIVQNRYGLFVDNPATTGNGIVTNNYGIFVTNQVGGQLNFAIYSAGGFNYHGGASGFGTIIPTQLVDINGATRHRGAIYDTLNSPGPNLGIVTQYLASYNGIAVSWMPVKRSMIIELLTAYTVSTAGIDPGVFIMPYDPNDGVSVMNFTFKRVVARCETTSATGITTINVSKSTGTGAFSGSNILTNSINVTGVNEGFSTTFTISTAQSGDKLAVNFVGTSPTFANWTVEVIARET